VHNMDVPVEVRAPMKVNLPPHLASNRGLGAPAPSTARVPAPIMRRT